MIRLTTAALFCAACAHAAIAEPVTFIFAGQSNMVGIGGGSACGPDSGAIPYSWFIQSWPSQWGSESPDSLRPLTAAADGYTASGPELAFMCWVAQRYQGEIRAVKVASNGTSIIKWQPGRTLALHEEVISRTLAIGGRPAALVWVQGASDAHSSEHANQYDLLLDDAVTLWREALGGFTLVQAQQHPATGMGSADFPSNWFTQQIRDSKMRYTDADPDAVLVETAGLQLRDCPPSGPGCIHYSRSSLDGLGEGLASAFWRHRFPQDINQDGVVDTADLGRLLAAFGAQPGDADLNHDGLCDVADLSILIAAFDEPLAL